MTNVMVAMTLKRLKRLGTIMKGGRKWQKPLGVYESGAGAGNPLADILFTFLIAKVLRLCYEKKCMLGCIKELMHF